MPHQCLKCGETFAEGSTDLLEGCPSCEGTRFFYTDDPLEADEREELQEQTEDDVETMLQEMVQNEDTPDLGKDIWSREAWEKWIKLKASDDGGELELETSAEAEVSFTELAEAVDPGASESPAPESIADMEDTESEADEVEPVQIELGDVEETSPPSSQEDPTQADGPGETDEEPAFQQMAAKSLEPAEQPDDDGRPSTLNINDVGEYEIDVRRLLEDSPVIVERDGSYVIHLPSVFERES